MVFNTDIVIMGDYAQKVIEIDEHSFIFNKQNNFEMFVLAGLIGLYNGKFVEEYKNNGKSNETVSSSFRTIFNQRQHLERVIATFYKLEKKINGKPYSFNEIFGNDLDNDEVFSKDINRKFVNYIYHGIDGITHKYNIFFNWYATISLYHNFQIMEGEHGRREEEKKIWGT